MTKSVDNDQSQHEPQMTVEEIVAIVRALCAAVTSNSQLQADATLKFLDKLAKTNGDANQMDFEQPKAVQSPEVEKDASVDLEAFIEQNIHLTEEEKKRDLSARCHSVFFLLQDQVNRYSSFEALANLESLYDLLHAHDKQFPGTVLTNDMHSLTIKIYQFTSAVKAGVRMGKKQADQNAPM